MINLYPKFNKNEYILGEILLDKRNVILPLKCEDYGITPLPIERNEGVEYGEQGVVGTLYLTNYRLFFKSVESWGRIIDGRLSIFLPSIVELENTSYLTSRAFIVKTKFYESKFYVFGPGWLNLGFGREKSFIEAINNSISNYHNFFNSVITDFLIKDQDLVYHPFKINKHVNAFFMILTPFLHPKPIGNALMNEGVRLSDKTSSIINEKCLGYKFLTEFKSEI